MNKPADDIEKAEALEEAVPGDLDRDRSILAELEKSLEAGKARWKPEEGSLTKVLEDLIWFLEERPEPPDEWKNRLGDKARLYDYHQVVLPRELCDPEDSEEESLKDLLRRYGKEGFLALEHFLVTRNHFLWTSGHRPPLKLTGPLLMLESMEGDEEVDWDCCFHSFPDGSFSSYGLDKDDEEVLGMDGSEELRANRDILVRMHLHFGIEGEDYGIIGPES